MKYKILIARTAIELSEGVNRHIEKEWRPLGGMACTTGADGITLYMQAVDSDAAQKNNPQRTRYANVPTATPAAT